MTAWANYLSALSTLTVFVVIGILETSLVRRRRTIREAYERAVRRGFGEDSRRRQRGLPRGGEQDYRYARVVGHSGYKVT